MARSRRAALTVAFPAHMGQSGLPWCLLDGSAFVAGEAAAPAVPEWVALEQEVHASAVAATDPIRASAPDRAAARRFLDGWSTDQARRILDIVRSRPYGGRRSSRQ